MSKGTVYLRDIASRKIKGIPSLCSSNEMVLEAAIEYARDNGVYLLIECTANQVNQYGGYTGMKPLAFKNFVFDLADGIGLEKENIILGGDHLGPVVFKQKNAVQAMAEAEVLITEFVKAGFEKIHIDTSMRLGDDPADQPLRDEAIAQRGARLCKIAEQTYKDTFGRPSELVYVVGSEVPVPGGAQSDHEEKIQVTRPKDFEGTVKTFKRAFDKAHISDVLDRVIAVVVQPGVEFGDDTVHEYDRENAKKLTEKLCDYPGIVFEGHSTDYQTSACLKQMMQDGIAILKVGPELTFAVREGLFALQHIADVVGIDADFVDTLEKVMQENPSHWKKYYTGTKGELAIKRKYSFSDRWRYYASQEDVKAKAAKLFNSMDNVQYPITLLSQYMPVQYSKVREKVLEKRPYALVKDKVKEVLEKYYSVT